MGEGAVDSGGPTREFFTLSMKNLLTSRFFVGPEDSKNFGLDAIGLSRGMYTTIGKLLSVCVVHGGVGPHVFSKRLMCQLVGEPTPPVSLSEVDDVELRSELEKIQQALDVSEIQDATLAASSNLAMLGALNVVRSLSDRDDLISSALQVYLEGRVNAPLRQLQDGLETLGVLQALRESSCLRVMFSGGPPAPLTALQLTQLFQVTFSVRGSSRRSEEERAVGFWRDWLIDVEGGEALLIVEGEPLTVTLEQVLMFATGAPRIPPLGFQCQPTLAFLELGRKFPEANTCGLVFRLPTLANYEEFAENMVSGIIQSPHFGVA